MALSFLERTTLPEHARNLALSTYAPEIVIEGVVTGIDNIRHDVHLSPRFADLARAHISDLILKYGGVEDFVRDESLARTPATFPPGIRRPTPGQPAEVKPADRAADFRKALVELQVASLNIAKAESNVCVDLLQRLAVVKLLRIELGTQFNQVLERCRARLKSYEGVRAGNRSLEMRDRFLKFQVTKKIVLRKAGQELFATLRDVEKGTVARMRRSLFGDPENPAYELFQNRLLFTDEGRDDYLNAEHYVMLGNFERDPDRFAVMVEIACDFLRNLEIAKNSEERDALLDQYLSVPENAQELVGGGVPQEATGKTKAQKALLAAWTNGLESVGVMQHVIASYEVVPLLAEFSPLINPQQLKNALISRSERKRVEHLLDEHGKISPEKIQQAVKRVDGYGSSDRTKLAGRFMSDLMRYHRDMRRMEAVNAAIDTLNLIGNQKLRELSSINNTLYEFLLPEEQRPAEDKVVSHIILKADIRDSTTLTRTLFERGLNPASYFSLNFYEPVNKLLAKYAATKVFIEGDAVILAMFEREGEPGFGVSRACMMAREMIDIVGAYNRKSLDSGLPALELGIGICFQDSAPMYLMDGNNRIMISKALNESDRLSGCTKGSRRYLQGRSLPFSVFSFQTVEDSDTGGIPDEFLMRYNVGGIHINEVAFSKLRQEISLQEHLLELPMLWGTQPVRLYSGLVPVAADVFRRIVIREGIIPHINATDFTVKRWTERKYYEVCTAQEIYELVEKD